MSTKVVLRVYCIEGCHGCGKTEIVNGLKSRGCNILDEGFLDMPDFDLPAQSFTVELLWVARWVERVLAIARNCAGGSADAPPLVYFADRSPYSAMLYAPNGVLFKPVIYEMMRDLAAAGVVVTNILVNVAPETLWERIQRRLKIEPSRSKYNEGSRNHMDRVVEFYKSHSDLWRDTIDNTSLVPTEAVLELVRK